MAKEDIDFIHSMQAQATATTSKKADYLFYAIVAFFAIGILTLGFFFRY